MPAIPFGFGDRPRFSDYLSWAQEQGCDVRTGVAKMGKLGMVELIKITTPLGKRALQVNVRQDEFLPDDQIAYLNRRLGLSFVWPKPKS